MNALVGLCFQPRPFRGSGLVGVSPWEARLGRGRSTPTDRLGPRDGRGWVSLPAKESCRRTDFVGTTYGSKDLSKVRGEGRSGGEGCEGARGSPPRHGFETD